MINENSSKIGENMAKKEGGIDGMREMDDKKKKISGREREREKK